VQGPFDIAADLDTPVSAFLKLRPFDPCFLLESVEGGERLGRYSFIGFGDRKVARIDRRDPAASGGSVAERLREALASSPRPGPAIPGVPFQGGLVGVAAYDLARRLAGLPASRHRSELPIDAAYVAPRSLIVFDHVTRRAALLHDGSDSERRALRREIGAALRGALPAATPATATADPTASFTEDGFNGAVRRVKGHIEAGDVFQLVLSVRFAGRTDLDPFTAYRALRLLNPSPYMYFWSVDGLSVVGSSPEALVRLEGRRALLRPIAGTRPRGEDAEADGRLERELLADPKEAAEHVMLVDLARNDLGRVAAPGSIEVKPFRTVERYSHVMHLVSGVTGVLLPTRDGLDLFTAAFPAGTVAGAPKIRAMELIDELEPCGRGLYAGSVGYFGHGGGMDQAITIRTLVFHDGAYAFQAGAGIVADSDPDREWAEVHAKRAALEAALRLAREAS
jgi:anthranilate synthase component 1